MLWFVLIFLSIYTGMHALIYWGVSPLLKGHPALPAVTLAWMGMMILMPVIIRVLDVSGSPGLARPLAWIGYSWMGFAWLAFAAFWVQGIIQVVRGVTGFPAMVSHGPAASAIILLLVTCVGLYGLYEASNLRTETLRIVSTRLPKDHPGWRVVQVSDIHLGLIHQHEALAPIISRIRQLRPDILVATGDIVDAELSHLDGLSELWHEIEPPLGKFAVTGNHETYAGLDQALGFLRRSGFVLLRNEARQVAPLLSIIGLDDPTRGVEEDAALAEQLDGEGFRILLKHRPVPPRNAVQRFELQLSGHAHRGQIFPFNLLTRLRYPLQNGLSRLGDGQWLYSSRGTGTWGPPMRVFSKPEVTLIEIFPGGQP